MGGDAVIADKGTPRIDSACTWLIVTCAIIFVLLVVL
jgi:hypothetical protein